MAGVEGAVLALFGVSLFAASVDGALGYGFSSLTVPLALLFFPNRILSPALVLVELASNSWVVVMNRENLAAARGRAMPIIVGLIPGILIGSYLLTRAEPGRAQVLDVCCSASAHPLVGSRLPATDSC